VILFVINAKQEGTWRSTVGNPRSVWKEGLIKERNGSNNHSGNEFWPSESSSQPAVQSTQYDALDRKIMNFWGWK